MTLSITQRILCELHTVGAMNEQTGLSGKDIADLMNTKQAPARLVELRKSGYVKSSDRSTGAMRFWLTPAGETYAIEMKHYAEESKQDQPTDANLNQENNDNENNELTDVDDTNVVDSQANSDDNCMNCTQNSCGSCDEAKPIPLPQYNPDDVAFKKSDTVFWYTVDGIEEAFETSSDAIAAAHDYVAAHTMGTTVHAIASRKFAIIKPVVTTELEYV